jgi:hypothetical protein
MKDIYLFLNGSPKLTKLYKISKHTNRNTVILNPVLHPWSCTCPFFHHKYLLLHAVNSVLEMDIFISDNLRIYPAQCTTNYRRSRKYIYTQSTAVSVPSSELDWDPLSHPQLCVSPPPSDDWRKNLV